MTAREHIKALEKQRDQLQTQLAIAEHQIEGLIKAGAPDGSPDWPSRFFTRAPLSDAEKILAGVLQRARVSIADAPPVTPGSHWYAEDIRKADTADDMRAEIYRQTDYDQIVRYWRNYCDTNGIGGEDSYVLLAYKLLCRVALMTQANIAHAHVCKGTIEKEVKS